jgi:Holliday junction resolvase RusA-like endonuclease
VYDSDSNSYVFFQGRYYDLVFGHLFDFPVPTSQTRSKEAKIEFRKRIWDMLDSIKTPKWPYKNRLTITVEVRGSESYIQRIDLDNTLKILLDTLKTKVFVDDRQIYSIMATKHIKEPYKDKNGQYIELHGFMVGLRLLRDNESNICIPPLYSENPQDGIGTGSTTMWRAVEQSPKNTLT